jgi:hypothetical protein
MLSAKTLYLKCKDLNFFKKDGFDTGKHFKKKEKVRIGIPVK